MAVVAFTESYWDQKTKVAVLNKTYTDLGVGVADQAPLLKRWGECYFVASSLVVVTIDTAVADIEHIAFWLSLLTKGGQRVSNDMVSTRLANIYDASQYASYIKVAEPVYLGMDASLSWKFPELDTAGVPTAYVEMMFKVLMPDR